MEESINLKVTGNSISTHIINKYRECGYHHCMHQIGIWKNHKIVPENQNCVININIHNKEIILKSMEICKTNDIVDLYLDLKHYYRVEDTIEFLGHDT